MDGCADGRIHGRVTLVIGTRRDSPAMARAEAAGIETRVVSPRGLSEEEYAENLRRALLPTDPDLLCLAGYMLRLPEALVRQYQHRVMNVHPALLPLFGGRGMFGEYVHAAAIASGMKVSGCTVHFVDSDYDTGPIIVQRCVPIEPDDTPQTLAARVLPEEHRAYAEAVSLFAMGRLVVESGRVRVLPPT
jgi:formyltetrahydrofolate-dependent phosphoribosylglycinamide formyltransferase